MREIAPAGSLVARIDAAFEGTTFPGEEHLTDSFGDEAADLVADFRDKHCWRSLTPEFLNQAPRGWGTALSFFSAAALRFYLPAYLIAEIEGKLDIDAATTRLCAFVTPQMAGRKLARVYGGGTLGEHARREFACFDLAQVRAIVDYLWWRLEAGDDPLVEQALEHYWLPREEELAGPA